MFILDYGLKSNKVALDKDLLAIVLALLGERIKSELA